MEIRDYLNRLADFCGRKNWADFSPYEARLLINIFEEIDQDAYNRALEENQCYDESDIDDARQEGYDNGYDDGWTEAKATYEKVREEATAGGETELEKLELEFYRQWILEHDLAFELIKDYEKWKQNRK